jgi:tetratricopeptide (TPR) repeat protein
LVESIADSKYFNDKGIQLYMDSNDYYYSELEAESIKCFDKAIELEPTSSAAYYNKANALKKQGRTEDAAKSINKAIELNRRLIFSYEEERVRLNEVIIKKALIILQNFI